MPHFEVQYVRYGSAVVEAANAEEAEQAVRDMAANGDAAVSLGGIEVEAAVQVEVDADGNVKDN